MGSDSVQNPWRALTLSKQRTEASLSDEWETPQELFDELCKKYSIDVGFDVASTDKNFKGDMFWLTIEEDALKKEWIPVNYKSVDVWCNPPHSQTKQFVIKACEQWQKHNINIMMIIPANSICTKYAEECIKPHAEFHPIYFRPKFLRDGKPSKDPARNAYFVVIWRKRP